MHLYFKESTRLVYKCVEHDDRRRPKERGVGLKQTYADRRGSKGCFADDRYGRPLIYYITHTVVQWRLYRVGMGGHGPTHLDVVPTRVPTHLEKSHDNEMQC